MGSRTLQKYLHQLGYRHCIARRRPFLKDIDKKRRLAYAKKYSSWTEEDWKRVIWTDEMSIKIGLARGTQDWVWRKPDEEWHPDCIDARKKPGNGVMFWGSFRWGCIGPGTFFELEEKQKVNSTVYHDQILLGPLKDMWEESFGEVDPIVMEDGAPVH